MRDVVLGSSVSGASLQGNATISFVEHFARSQQFDQIFRAGMALVEETACYLDGPGRREAKGLPPSVTMLYATESMRLTTRLLEIASWLLVRRSLKAGEISTEEARIKRRRIKLATIGRPSHVKGHENLPAKLRELVDASFALNDRIVQLDKALENSSPGPTGASGDNPVILQIAQIEAAFTEVSLPLRP